MLSYENDSCEWRRVVECHFHNLTAFHTVSDADDGSGHEVSFEVDEIHQVSRMIIPARVVADEVFV